MRLLTPEKGREILRAYPWKKGKSELKKALACFFPQNEPCVITTVDGLRLYLNNYKDNARVFWWFEEQEPALQYYIRSFLPVGARFLDVGAAHGIIGLLAARLKGAEAILVEANPAAIALIEKSLELNRELSSSCRLIGQPCALGAVDARYEDRPAITIEKIIRDAGWNHLDFLKVDVDGPDFDVLKSAGACLRPDFIEAIYIETECAALFEIEDLLRRGYVPYGTKRTHMPELRRLSVNQTEKVHFQALDPAALTEENVPSNILFLEQKSAVNQHLLRWCR